MMTVCRPVLFVGCLLLFAGTVFGADTAHLYKSKCQGCHGASGKATAVGKKIGARDFQDPAVASMSKEDLETITKDGKNKMPAYKGKLKDQQISDLAQYIKDMK
jgi:cytochrome c6